MDLFVIRGIVEELNQEIGGGFITKIYQMNRTDMLFRIRIHGREKQVVISTHPDFYRLHLTEKKYANPLIPPRFCTYLRKHTTGARIAEITQQPYERVARVTLQKKLDAGLIRNLVLVIELAGKGSNILLVEGEKILDCLHFRRAEEGASRPAVPGLPYLGVPALDRLILPEVTPETTEAIAPAPPGERWKSLVQKISGLSPLLAREIEWESDGTGRGLWENFRKLLARYEQVEFEPRISTLLGDKKILCPFLLKSLGPASEEVFDSMNRAADSFYFDVVMKRQMADQKQAIAKRVRQLLARLQKRKENLLLDREKFQADLESKDYGDILTANYPRLKKGMAEVEALDYRVDPPRPVLVPLEEALDPSGNVQRYFRKYKKAKRGLEMVGSRLSETDQEIAYLDSVLFQMEEAEDAEEVEAIRHELQEERVLTAHRREAKREKKEPALPVRRLRSSEGLEVFCGKHNLGNEYLLRKVAKDHDLWFHAQGIPGSHVVLKTGKGPPKMASLLEAATVAAYYSRGRGSTRVPVDYTEVRNLRRPKGAKPGMVTFFHQKTLTVRPDKETVEKLSLQG